MLLTENGVEPENVSLLKPPGEELKADMSAHNNNWADNSKHAARGELRACIVGSDRKDWSPCMGNNTQQQQAASAPPYEYIAGSDKNVRVENYVEAQ